MHVEPLRGRLRLGVERSDQALLADDCETAPDDVVQAAHLARKFEFIVRRQQAGAGRIVDDAAREAWKGWRRRGPAMQEHFVARPRGLGVRHADHFPHFHRNADEAVDIRRALRLIGVEQGFARLAFQHAIELPGEVPGVAQARAHALSHEWRHQMRGVARDQQRPLAPALRQQRTEPVDRMAHQRPLARLDPGRQQLPGLGLGGEVGGIFAGLDHELPAAVRHAARHDRCRPLGIAPLRRVGDRQIGEIVRTDVDDEPLRVKTMIDKVRADRLSHQTVRAVAADDEARRQDFYAGRGCGARRGVEGRDFDPRPARDDLDALRLAAQEQVYARPACEVVFEHALEFGLVEQIAGAIAGQRRARLVDVDQHLPVRVVPDIVVHRPRDFLHLSREAERIKHALDLVIVADRARQRIGFRPALDDRDLVPGVAEQSRQRLAGRAVADDDDVVVHGALPTKRDSRAR